MPRPGHYLAERDNWQKKGLRKADSAERDVFIAFKKIIDMRKYQAVIKPKDANNIYMPKVPGVVVEDQLVPRQCGIEPEMSITNKQTGKKIFIEVKHQQDAGNAHERMGKYFAPGLYKKLQKIGGVDAFPVFFIFAGDIVDGKRSPKYKAELLTWFDDPLVENNILLWYKRDMAHLRNFFENNIRPVID